MQLQLMKNKATNLRESKEGYVGGLGVSKGKREM